MMNADFSKKYWRRGLPAVALLAMVVLSGCGQSQDSNDPAQSRADAVAEFIDAAVNGNAAWAHEVAPAIAEEDLDTYLHEIASFSKKIGGRESATFVESGQSGDAHLIMVRGDEPTPLLEFAVVEDDGVFTVEVDPVQLGL